MIKRAILGVLSLFLGAKFAFGACDPTTPPSYTPKVGLAKPVINACGWGSTLNADFDIIDSSFTTPQNILNSTNTFTGVNSFTAVSATGVLSVKSGYGLSLFNSFNNASATFENFGASGKSNLEIDSKDGFGINGAGLSPLGGNPSIVVYPSNFQTYGSFGVIGSSANSSVAYSGFIATSPISQSTLWSLPKKDGLANQPLITNGSGNLSFLSLPTNQCVQTDVNGALTTSGSSCGSSGGGGSSSLGIFQNGVQITSPTSQININGNDIAVSAHGTTAYLSLNAATTDFIHNQTTAQSATFNVTSGTVSTAFLVPYIGATQFVFTSPNNDGTLNGDNSLTYDPTNHIIKMSNPIAGTDVATMQLGRGTTLLVAGYNSTGTPYPWISTPNSELCFSASGNDHNCELTISNSGGLLNDSFAVAGHGLVGDSHLNGNTNTFDVANTFGNGGASIGYPFASEPTVGNGGLDVKYGVLVGTLTLRNVASGTQCLHADGSGNVTGTGSDCSSGGGGGSSPLETLVGVRITSPTNSMSYYSGDFLGSANGTTAQIYLNPSTTDFIHNQATPQTAQFNVSSGAITGPSGLNVTYGITAGSETISAPGDGIISLTIQGSTYTVISDSMVPSTVGQCAVFSSTSGTIIGQTCSTGGAGTPSAPFNSVQYNNAGSFGGSNNFEYNGTSVTLIGSMTVTDTLGKVDPSPGQLDVFLQNVTAGQPIFSVGSSNQSNQLVVKDQSALDLRTYGTRAGNLNVGIASFLDRIMSTNATSQNINFWNGGEMDLVTSNIGDGGTTTNAIVFKPNEVTEMSVSSFSITASTFTQINAPLNVFNTGTDKYEASFSTTSTFFHVQISTSGHVLSNGTSPTISSCGSTPNGSVSGDDYSGTITVGGGSVTACTMTFAQTYGTGCTVVCTTSDSITTATPDVVSTPTTMTLGFSATIGGGSVNYHCTGHGSACK